MEKWAKGWNMNMNFYRDTSHESWGECVKWQSRDAV